MMFRLFVPFILLHFSITCSSQNNQNFDWLIGSWKVNRAKETNVEIWEKLNDSLYSSKSFVVTIKDTTLFETVELKKNNGSWYYIVTASNQNDNKPVSFKLAFIGNKEFICLNLNHDFPTRIAYRLAGKKLFASIEGQLNDNLKKINFDYLPY